MAKHYTCDSCGRDTTSRPEVKLRGVSAPSGDILLPDACHRKHFCTAKCFWGWAERNLTMWKQRRTRT